MDKTIIAVHGTANIGKSMTLSYLGRHLQAAGATTNSNISGKDYIAVFQYLGLNVGIQTYGDKFDLVRDGLDYLHKASCEIIAIATKGYGKTVRHLKSFASSNGFRVIWVAPYEVKDGNISVPKIKSYGGKHLHLMIDDIISGSL